MSSTRRSGLASLIVAPAGLAVFPAALEVGALDPARVTGALLGVLTAVVLVWIELFRINAICLRCTGVHVCTLVVLGIVLWTASTVRAEYAAQS